MKRSLVVLILLIACCLYSVSHSIGILPSPGTRVWNLAREDNLISNTIESKVSQLTIDFAGTFTVLDTILSKLSLTEGQVATLDSQLDDLQVNFAIDLSKVSVIEDNLTTIQLSLESIDTAGTFTALDALKQTVCSKIELLNNQLNEVQTDITDLTATEIDHAATIASQLDLLDQEVTSINSILDTLNFDIQLNTACSLLDVIDSCLQTVDSKVYLLDGTITTGFAGTFTALDANLQKACIIESLVDDIPMSFFADLSETFSVLNELQQKICTIGSKVDEVDMSIMSVESEIDVLDTTLDPVVSKLCVLESKTDTIIDSTGFSLFDNAIQVLGQDCSILEELNNNQMLEKSCTIESNLDVITPDLLTQESKLEVIEQDLQTVASKVCAIQTDDTAISKLCLVDSKLDVEFDTALTIESLIDVIEGIESNIDVVDDLGQTIFSKLCVIEDDTQTICSNLDLLLSSQQTTESKLELLLTASPAPGSLCLDFGSNGLVTTSFTAGDDVANAAVLQPDGKIIAVGQAEVGGTDDFALARYNSDGSLDTTFGTGGLVTTSFTAGDDVANAAVLQSDGKIIAAGRAGAGVTSDFALARYNSDGSLDTTFGTGGLVITSSTGNTNTFRAVVLQPNGKIIAVGDARFGGGELDFVLARYNSDGSLDTTFGIAGTGLVTTALTAGNNLANAAVLQPDGKIIAAGRATIGGSNFAFALARYDSDGILDPTFGTGGFVLNSFTAGQDRAQAAVLQPDGKIIAVGAVQIGGSNFDFALARYNSDGSLDTTFGTSGLATTNFGGTDVADAAVLQPDGKIIAAGRTGGDFALARYNSDGSLDATFGTGGRVITDFGVGFDQALAAVLQPDGKLIAVGEATSGASENFALACYETSPLPIRLVNQEVELLCNQIDNLSTPTLVSKICLIEDQVCTIESTLDVVGPLIGMLNMQAQELIGDFQETWTILQVIEDKICISESLLDDAQTILDQLDLSSAFTPIEAIDQKARIVDGKVNTYESLVDAIVNIDFSGVFTALDVVESKVCLVDDLAQLISTGIENVQDALGIPIFQSDVGTTGFVVPASGRYYLAEDITFEPIAAGNAAIRTVGIDNVTIDLNGYTLSLPTTIAFNADGVDVSTSNNVRIMNGVINNFTGRSIFCNISRNISLFDVVSISRNDSIDLFRCRNLTIKNCVLDSGRFGVNGGASTDAVFNTVIKNCLVENGVSGLLFNGSLGGLNVSGNLCIEDCALQQATQAGVDMRTVAAPTAILNCSMKDCDVGIDADPSPMGSDIPALDVRGCKVSNNASNGIRVGGSNSTITRNVALNNGMGISVQNSTPADINNNFVAFNTLIENGTNLDEVALSNPNTYLGNFAFNSTAVGDPDNTNYTINGGSDITRKFVTVSQTSSFSDRPTEWHNINMLP